MTDEVTLSLDEQVFATISEWGNIMLMLKSDALFMLKCDDEIKIGWYAHFFEEPIEEYTCTVDIIKSLDWEFTGCCMDTPNPFNENYFSFFYRFLKNWN